MAMPVERFDAIFSFFSAHDLYITQVENKAVSSRPGPTPAMNSLPIDCSVARP